MPLEWPCGQVLHTFSMGLLSTRFIAHLGGYDSSFLDPSSQECLEKVKEITKEFQEVYSAEDMEYQNKVHLLPYPVFVHQDGTVEAESGWEMFPDTVGLVCGKKSGVLPGNLTT